VVALVPAKDREDSVAATVTALRALPLVDGVLVIDDGSTDGTTAAALGAGAEVLRLPVNRGKGGAIAAGAAATPDADVYLMIDADLAATAAAADVLLQPVLDGDADMTIGVLPAAGSRGGFGKVRDLARSGIRRACGFDARAPLSGQRAVRADLVRSLGSAERFGLEVALTIDAVRSGARVVEVDVPMDHRHTGRTVAGFAHRGRQGADIVRALWPRLVPPGRRVLLIALATIVVVGAMVWSGGRAEPSSTALPAPAGKVVVFGIPRLSLDDLDRGVMPNLERLVARGAVGATSVRTLSGRPSAAEAYATLGAGTRVKARSGADEAYDASTPLEGDQAAAVTARRLGLRPHGDVVVVGAAPTLRSPGADVSSDPGALGEVLRGAGRRTAVVGSADYVDLGGVEQLHRPAAIAVMDHRASVDHGSVEGDGLLVDDARAPFGRRADAGQVVATTVEALRSSDVVLVDPGDTERAAQYAGFQTSGAAAATRDRSLRWTDAILGAVVRRAGPQALVVVAGMTPPSRDWALTPTVIAGPGVPHGELVSPSTRRRGLVTITDLAPTILGALGVHPSTGMIGAELRYHEGDPDLARMRRADDVAGDREGIYFPMVLAFVLGQAAAYAIAAVVLSRDRIDARIERAVRLAVLTFAAWPLATFLLRAVPVTYGWGAGAQVLVWAVAFVAALAASRARRHPLAPLAWIAGVTVAVLLADVATGARLQMSSILGYSPHAAARYTGLGNPAFAVLAGAAVVAAAAHVHYAVRRRDALVAAVALLGVVVLADGWPTLGSDVGGILTLVPVFGLMLYVMSGRRLTWRVLAVAALATLAVLGAAVIVDLLRPADTRTHLARFASDVGGDNGTALTTVARKWSTNVRVLRGSVWTWVVPIIGAFLVYLLVAARGWRSLLPPATAVRAGMIGILGAGVLGWLVNDSGIVVTALVLVFAGPYVALLALHQRRGEPVLLRPAAGAGDGRLGSVAG
jgi:hypothetical protein